MAHSIFSSLLERIVLMEERMVKTHLIVTDIHEEYFVNWFGSLMDTSPLIKNGLPVFVIISSTGRIELNTANINYIERCAKSITSPKGRQSITTDKARIYIKEEDGNEVYIGVVEHNHVKTYAPMYDKVGWK